MRSCGIEGCEQKHLAKGLCKLHYERAKRGTAMDYEPTVRPPICTIDGCVRATLARGLCGAHYQRAATGRPLDAPMRPRSRSLVERFWEKVDRRGADECWPWRGSIDSRGYGAIYIGSPLRTRIASRLSYELAHGLDVGSLSRESVVCHRCDNPPCVNPAHLWLGDHQSNAQDAIRKGRLVVPRRVGESAPAAKLTEAQAARALRDAASVAELAAEFGVSETCIQDIRARRTWRHLKEEAA